MTGDSAPLTESVRSAVGGRDVPRDRVPWLVAATVLAAVLLTAAILLRHDRHVLIYYGDAASHMVGARRLADWGEDLGIARFGTVWLPLPHLMLLPFTLFESLLRTGLAGAVVGAPCLSATAVLLYRLIRERVGASPAVAAAGALLYALNPNVLYLSATAMTEAPFMLFFVGAAYGLYRWWSRPASLGVLAVWAFCVAAATLCRYEGWILAVAFTPVVAARAALAVADLRRRVAGVLIALAALSGTVTWTAYNLVVYGDPLAFAKLPYYSAAAQASARDIRASLFLQPLHAISVYGVIGLAVFGPMLLAAAGAGATVFRLPRARAGGPLVAFLAAPPVGTVVLLVAGIAEMTTWFNARFVLLAGPLLVLLAACSIDQLARRPGGRVAAALLVVVALVGFVVALRLDRVPTWLDARNGYTYRGAPDAVHVGEVLAAAYDGGKIMMVTGSAQEHRVMVAAGIPLGQYDEILDADRDRPSYTAPWRYDRWLILGKEPDADAAAAAGTWLARGAELDEHYETYYDGPYYRVLVARS